MEMAGKIVTAVYLAIMSGLVVSLLRLDFTAEGEDATNKFLSWFSCAYVLAITWIFIKIYDYGHFDLFILLTALSPVVFLVVGHLHRRNYQGSLNLLLATILLSSMGIVVLFRIQQTTKGFFSRLLKSSEGLPIVTNHFTFTILSLIGIVFLIGSGRLENFIGRIERNVSEWFLGIFSFILLLLPWILVKVGIGTAVGRTSAWMMGRSGQVSEIVCKIVFCAFLAKFLSKRKLSLNYFSAPKEVIKTVTILFALVGVYFFIPIVFFQRDLGSVLMTAMCTLFMIAIVTGRASFMVAGILLIVLFIALVTLFSPHVSERIAGWLQFESYAFKPYPGGSDRWPGYQLFSALSAVKGGGLFGTGLGCGLTRVKHVSTDFIGAAIYEELGLFGLLIISGCFLLYCKELFKVNLRSDFKGLMLIGLCVSIVSQAYFNIAFSLGLLPTSGLPLIFVSNGGSSIVAGYLSVAIMIILLKGFRTPGRAL